MFSLFPYLQRKRKKGGLKLEDGEGGSADQQKGEDEPKEDSFVMESKKGNEEKQKKKADDLWASFLSDVGPRNKAAAASTGSQQVTVNSRKRSKWTIIFNVFVFMHWHQISVLAPFGLMQNILCVCVFYCVFSSVSL